MVRGTHFLKVKICLNYRMYGRKIILVGITFWFFFFNTLQLWFLLCELISYGENCIKVKFKRRLWSNTIKPHVLIHLSYKVNTPILKWMHERLINAICKHHVHVQYVISEGKMPRKWNSMKNNYNSILLCLHLLI